MDRFRRYTSFMSPTAAIYGNDQYLLLVDRSVNSESYRRLYFKDIQSISIVPTNGRLLVNFGWGVPAAITGLIAFGLIWEDVFGAVCVGVITLILLAMVVVNSARGKACRVYGCTAVQRALLPGINRMPRAFEFLRQIAPMIEREQGKYTKAELQEALVAGWKAVREKSRMPESKRMQPASKTVTSAPETVKTIEYQASEADNVDGEEVDVADS